jgi:glycosyltransferase involved in cell wall biosynthesis
MLSFPGTKEFIYTIGTNSSFRRKCIVELGGFDEEFEYYLDETDLCLRITDAGWIIAALDTGFVFHKFLPSDIRERRDVVRDWYQVLKSRFYFGIKHGLPSSSFAEVCINEAPFVEDIRANVVLNVEAGVHEPEILTKFEDDLVKASNLALEHIGHCGTKERPPSWFDNDEPFLPFAVRQPPGGKLHICILTQEYPPAAVNGIARVLHALAEGLAAEGHVVRVLTDGTDHPRVDLENGVWVHRVPAAEHPLPPGSTVPQHIWNRSASLLAEVDRMAEIRPIDVIQAPNWDSEGIAAIVDGRYPVVLGLYTPLRTVIEADPAMQRLVDAGDPLLPALVDAERSTYEEAAGFLACGPAIVEEIESGYGVAFDRARLGFVPHGLPDLAEIADRGPDGGARHGGASGDAGDGAVRILFVGRLEGRKGIDTLLEAVPQLVALGDDVVLTVVGDDSLPGPDADGLTYRQGFERRHPELADRVRFLGRVGDDELVRQYATTDVFVAPSRFESFGLMLLEAMMFAKPVVCADVGGMRDIVEDGVTGIRVPPDDVAGLVDALHRLAGSSELRAQLGKAGRERYVGAYSVRSMVAGVVSFYRSLLRRRATA